jgi:hypothetical protein
LRCKLFWILSHASRYMVARNRLLKKTEKITQRCVFFFYFTIFKSRKLVFQISFSYFCAEE